MSRKLIVNDGRRERELVLVGPIVVGRDPTCDISEPDPLLSRRHAEFSSDGASIVVRDLGSRNGIYVNGARKAETRLRSGDLVQIGNLQLRYVEDASPITLTPELEDVDATGMIHSSAAGKSASPAAGSGVRSGVKPAPPASTSGGRPPAAPSASAPRQEDDNDLTGFVPPPSQQGPAGLSAHSRPDLSLAPPMKSQPGTSRPPAAAAARDIDQTSLVPGPGSTPAPRSAPVAAAVATPAPGASRASAPVRTDDADQTRIVSQPVRAAAPPQPPVQTPSPTPAQSPANIVATLPSNREAHALSLAVGAIADFLGSTVSNPKAADVVNDLQQELALASDGPLGTQDTSVHADAKVIIDELNRLMARLRTASSDLT